MVLNIVKKLISVKYNLQVRGRPLHPIPIYYAIKTTEVTLSTFETCYWSGIAAFIKQTNF